MVVVQINASIISILNIMSPIFEASNGLRTERPAAFSDNASFLSIFPSPFYISPVDSAGSLFFFPGRFLRALFSFPPPSVFCTHPLVGSNEFSLSLEREREEDRCTGCPRTDDINRTGNDSDIRNI